VLGAAERDIDHRADIPTILSRCPPWIDWVTLDHAMSPGCLSPVLSIVRERFEGSSQWMADHPGAKHVPLGILGLAVCNQAMNGSDISALLKLLEAPVASAEGAAKGLSSAAAPAPGTHTPLPRRSGSGDKWGDAGAPSKPPSLPPISNVGEDASSVSSSMDASADNTPVAVAAASRSSSRDSVLSPGDGLVAPPTVRDNYKDMLKFYYPRDGAVPMDGPGGPQGALRHPSRASADVLGLGHGDSDLISAGRMASLFPAPEVHCGLRWLDLSGNQLNDADAARVLNSIRRSHTLLAVDLSRNNIGKVCVRVTCGVHRVCARVGESPTRAAGVPQGVEVIRALTGTDGLFYCNEVLQVRIMAHTSPW
jgi:hypothetical protein